MNGQHEGVNVLPSDAGPVRTKSKNAIRRAIKACVQCKSRKQRCSGPSSIPCIRCTAAKRPCSFSFSIDDALREDEADGQTATPLDLSVRTLADIKAE